MVILSVIGKVALWVTLTVAEQLSVAVGGVRLTTSHSAVMLDKLATSGIGAVTSSMITS